jgi:hypothetical protein
MKEDSFIEFINVLSLFKVSVSDNTEGNATTERIQNCKGA